MEKHILNAPFTVRWEVETGGLLSHRIIEADQVHAAFNNTFPIQELKLGVYNVGSRGVVVIGNPHEGSESMCLAHGMVYVMNRDAKTVAKYKLADPEVG